MEIKWEDLPSDGRSVRWNRSRPMHSDIADELRAHPDKWARVNVKPTPASAAAEANAINRGGLAAFRPKGAFLAVNRKVTDETTGQVEYRVYARYIGDSDKE